MEEKTENLFFEEQKRIEPEIKKKKSTIKIDKKIIVQLEEEVKDHTLIPFGYIEVKLDSNGKLSAPQILHFRNYEMSEIIGLAACTDEKRTEALIKCLNEMVWEDFDCNQLHERELEEILMYIHATYWGTFLSDRRFFIDDTITDEEKLNDEKNIAMTNIPISDIQTKLIDSEFQEPIFISLDKKKIGFRLPRVGDMIIAKKFIAKKYFAEERKVSDIKVKIDKKDPSLTYDEKEMYDKYIEDKSNDYLKIFLACSIHSINGKVLETLEEKIENFFNVPLDIWKDYNIVVKEKIQFGLVNDVTFTNIEDILDKDGKVLIPQGKKLTRRFSFQSMDFIPSLELPRNSRTTVSFGNAL